MIKKTSLLLGLIFCLVSTIAISQTPSSTQIKKVEKLLESVHFDQLMEQQIDAIVEAMAGEPSLASHAKEFRTFFIDIMDKENLKKEMMQAYLNSFTEEEIDEMIKFNQSPLGQKILKKMPELTKQISLSMQKNMTKNQDKIRDYFVKVAANEAAKQ